MSVSPLDPSDPGYEPDPPDTPPDSDDFDASIQASDVLPEADLSTPVHPYTTPPGQSDDVSPQGG